MLMLAVWLIIQGASAIVNISFPQMGTLMAVLALVSGVFLLMGR
jgi:hypothetical protein